MDYGDESCSNCSDGSAFDEMYDFEEPPAIEEKEENPKKVPDIDERYVRNYSKKSMKLAGSPAFKRDEEFEKNMIKQNVTTNEIEKKEEKPLKEDTRAKHAFYPLLKIDDETKVMRKIEKKKGVDRRKKWFFRHRAKDEEEWKQEGPFGETQIFANILKPSFIEGKYVPINVHVKKVPGDWRPSEDYLHTIYKPTRLLKKKLN